MKIKKYLKSLCVLLTSVIALNVSTSIVSADANTLNIKVYFSTNECGVYGVPSSFSTRLPRMTGKVYSVYKGIAGITLYFDFTPNGEHIRHTLIEDCNNTNTGWIDSKCYCWEISECRNGYTGNTSIKHHTNVYNVLNQIPNSSTNYAVMLLTPKRLCYQGHHIPLYGLCRPSLKDLIVRDYDFAEDIDFDTTPGTISTYIYGPKTMAHEIGHLYGVDDHYDQPYGLPKDNCIWGVNKNKQTVANGLSVCTDCAQTIRNNKSKFNHTPLT